MPVKDVAKMSVSRGELGYVWFNGYAGVLLKTSKKTLIFDPVEVRVEELPPIDVVFITHEHFDHLDESLVGDIYAANKCKVVADPTSYARLKGMIPSLDLIEAKVGDKIEVNEIVVNVEPSVHPAVTPVTYVVSTEDGVVVYHTSDSAPFAEMRRIGQTYRPDIAFCTVGIAPGASPQSGAEIAKLVEPGLAIPYHGTRLREFVEILSREAPKIKTKVIERDRVYKYP